MNQGTRAMLIETVSFFVIAAALIVIGFASGPTIVRAFGHSLREAR